MRIEFKDLTGKEFGYLTVIECLDDTTKGYTGLHWRCKCKCGNDNFITITSRLTSNNTKSCGCLKKESSPNNGKKQKNIMTMKYKKIMLSCILLRANHSMLT